MVIGFFIFEFKSFNGLSHYIALPNPLNTVDEQKVMSFFNGFNYILKYKNPNGKGFRKYDWGSYNLLKYKIFLRSIFPPN